SRTRGRPCAAGRCAALSSATGATAPRSCGARAALPCPRRWPGGAAGTRSADSCLHHHHTPQYLAPLHTAEGLLDLIEPDRLTHEAVEVEPALQVQVDEEGEVPRRQAVPVPGGLQGGPLAEEVDHRDLGEHHVGSGHADENDPAGEVGGVEGLAVELRVAHG